MMAKSKAVIKMMALVIATMMIAMYAVPMSVFAEDDPPAAGGGTPAAEDTVSISVSQDSTFAGEDGTSSRTFNWYKVFSATYGDDFTGNNNQDGGYDPDTGLPGEVAGEKEDNPISYTASATVAAKLGTWVAATYYEEGDEIPDGKAVGDVKEAAHWQKKAPSGTDTKGNQWFKLTPITGSTDYVVEWDNASETSETVQAAAQWLYDNAVYDTTGAMTWDSANKKWTADGVDKGYYLIVSDTGKNLVAATTNVAIKEKNAYPPLDKTQADEDNTTKDDEARDVAIGDKLDYEVKVTIPKTAKVGDEILVWDKASVGLTYNNDVAVKSNTGAATVADATPETGQAWAKKITVTKSSLGQDVIFSFSMTVDNDALVDTDKKNESGLKYGRNGNYTYESIPDEVEYKTYYAGIHKVDGEDNSKELEGVKFTLKEAGTEFKVSKHADGYYYPDATNGSSEVVTDAEGMIQIRGLDEDKTYTLTETETLPGYNMLEEDVTLTLHEDTYSSTSTPANEQQDVVATEFDADAIGYYAVYEGSDEHVTLSVTADNFADMLESVTGDNGTLYKTIVVAGEPTITNTSSYEEAADSDWGKVENFQGTILPSTGGIGTTMFYLIGALLIIGAGVLLVTRRRVNTEE